MSTKVAFQNVARASDMENASVKGGITIPKSAVRQIDGHDAVWVIRDGRAERRAITIGESRGDGVVVAAGLSGGEKVAVDAAPGVTDGARVTEEKR
jgi:hypothetical protein